MDHAYPRLVINLPHLKANVETVVKSCAAKGIKVAGVIKGANAIPECTRQFAEGGCTWLASSRLEQLEETIQAGIRKPLMLLRVPMMSEVNDVVRLADYSLNSDLSVMQALNEAAGRQHKIHNVIVMADLGDLREGFWDKDEMVDACEQVERSMSNLHLAGVGVNVGCYGSVLATPEKLSELVTIAHRVEERIGRKLEIVSGGATSSYMRILDGNMPEGINQLRIGEHILLARDLDVIYHYDVSDMYTDVFTLEAEVLEVRDKPSHPVGELGVDAFGRKQVYVDRGIRKKALLGMGRVDYGDFHDLFPQEEGVEILGASSDHTITDVTDLKHPLKAGDILKFTVNYASNVFLVSSRSVGKKFITK